MDFVGKPLYMAPENLRTCGGWELMASDIWAVGIMTYMLLIGCPPFCGETGSTAEIMKLITTVGPVYPEHNERLCLPAEEFLQRTLHKKTTYRLTAEAGLKHKWIKGEPPGMALTRAVCKHLRSYTRGPMLKKVLVGLVYDTLPIPHHNRLVSSFQRRDRDGDGYLDINEITHFIASTGVDYQMAYGTAISVVDEICGPRNRRLSFKQYVQAWICSQLSLNKKIREEFTRLDLDGDGYISVEDLMGLFSTSLSENLLVNMIHEVDLDGDDKISFEEFKSSMQDEYGRDQKVTEL